MSVLLEKISWLEIKMSDHSLPNQDGDLSDNDLDDGLDESCLITYVLRITPHGKHSFQDLHDFLKRQCQITQYVLSREEDPQEHFHGVLSVDETLSEQDVRDIIRAFIIPYWVEDSGKCPRGFGNKQYHLAVAKDKDHAVNYAVKQGTFVFEGFAEEYIANCHANSFLKKKPSNFKVEYLEMRNTFHESDMDVREFMIKYVILKSKYDQGVRMSDAHAQALSADIKRDNKRAEEYVENYLYRL